MDESQITIDAVVSRFAKIRENLNLKEKKDRLLFLEGQTTDPDFWKDQERARAVMQEFGSLKREIDNFEQLAKEIAAISDLGKDSKASELTEEVKRISKDIEKLELVTFLSGNYAKGNAIVAIHAGQGGTEAMDWANMLFRMYIRYCEKKGWKKEVVDETLGEEAGIKSVVFRVEGDYAYGYLKGEAGTHRLVRQSPFNADKLRQTSFALVEVLPELGEEDFPEVSLNEADLEWEFFRSSSQGGQNVQKVSTAVRVKHKPSGLVVSAQTERFQEQNRKIALSILRSRLWERKEEKLAKEKKELKGEYKPASWGNQIRSYVLHPYKMVKDLRTGVETSDTEGVLNGGLDNFIDAELRMSEI